MQQRSVSVRNVTDSMRRPNEKRSVALRTRRLVTRTTSLRVSPRIFLPKRSFSVHATSSFDTARHNGTARSRTGSSRDQASRFIFEVLARELVNGQFRRPVDLFTAMDEMKLLTTVNQCNELMRQFLKLLAAGAMIEFLKFMKWKRLELNEDTYTLIIFACMIESSLEKACLYFDQLKNSSDIPVTIRSYQAIIAACIECDDYGRAHKYFDEMLEAGIELNAASLHRVFRNLGYKKESPSEAAQFCMKVIQGMEKQGVQLTPEICDSAAWAFSHAEDTESLLALQEMMRNSGVKLRLRIYNGLFFALAKSPDNAEIGARLFEDMKENGIRPVPHTYHLLLRVFTTARDEVRSMALLEEMEEAGVELTLITCNSTINSFRRKFSESEKEEVWKRLEDLLSKMTAKGINADVLTYVELLDVCVTNGDRDHAEQFFEEMQIKKIPPDIRIFVRLIKLYAEGGDLNDTLADVERISALLQQMELNELQLNCAGCSQITWSLINSKSVERAQPFLEYMHQHEVHYDKPLLEHLLMFCIAADKTDMISEVVNAALKQNDLTENVIYHALLRALVCFRETVALIEQLEKMKEMGIRFGKITYNALEGLQESYISEKERSQINEILGSYSPFRER